jgi:hypothetical protein
LVNPFCKQNDQEEKGFITFETFLKEFILIGPICDILQKFANSSKIYPTNHELSNQEVADRHHKHLSKPIPPGDSIDIAKKVSAEQRLC